MRFIPTTPPICSQNQAPYRRPVIDMKHAPTAERTNTDFFSTLKGQLILE